MVIGGLLPSQVAALGQAAARAGFALAEFTSTELMGEWPGVVPAPALVHTPSGSFFGFSRSLRNYGYTDALEDVGFRVGFRPGRESELEDLEPLSWAQVMEAFTNWLAFIKRELGARDFWDVIAAPHAADDSPVEGLPQDDTPFTPTEREDIGRRLDAIEAMITDAAKQAGTDHDAVMREFADLRADLGKMKRGKWKKMVLGTLANMVLHEAVPPDAVRTAVEYSKDFLLGHMGPHLLG